MAYNWVIFLSKLGKDDDLVKDLIDAGYSNAFSPKARTYKRLNPRRRKALGKSHLIKVVNAAEGYVFAQPAAGQMVSSLEFKNASGLLKVAGLCQVSDEDVRTFAKACDQMIYPCDEPEEVKDYIKPVSKNADPCELVGCQVKIAMGDKEYEGKAVGTVHGSTKVEVNGSNVISLPELLRLVA